MLRNVRGRGGPVQTTAQDSSKTARRDPKRSSASGVSPKKVALRSVLAVAIGVGVSVAVVPFASSAFATGGWSPPAGIAPSIGGLYSVSCPTTTFCVAAGGSTDGYVQTYNGATWSAPHDIDAASNGFDSVSCPTASFCMAVDGSGDAYTYTSGTWTGPSSVDPGTALNAVDCTSSSFCVADDGAGNAFIYTGAWSSATPVGSGLNAISCPANPSPSFVCMIVANGGNEFTYDGTSWSLAVDADGANNLYSLSCPTTGFCVAGDWDGNEVTYKCTTWSSAVIVDPTGNNPLNGVSCPTARFCAAVGSTGNGFLYNGTTWSGPYAIDASSAPNFYMSSVSCPTTAFCAAVDDYGNALTHRTKTLQITTANTLPGAVPGTHYSASLAAKGGNSPYTWKPVRGAVLPRGLKLNKHTGVISGKPKTTDTGTYTVQVFDKKVKVKGHHPTQNMDSRVFSITVS